MTFNVTTGQSAQALYENIELSAHRGYAVESGGDVSINSGTLGQTDTLSVAAVDYFFDGDSISAGSSQNVQIDASDSEPRKDVVYLDGTGTAQVAKGTPAEPPQTQKDLGAQRFEYYQPTPPALDSTDAVVVAEVWVDAGASSLISADLGDRRAIGAGVGGGGGYETVTSTSSDYSASENELVLVDASGGAVTITLPTPEESKSLGVERTDDSDNDVTIDPNDGENVNYVASEDLVAQSESVDLVSDGTDWYIV